MADDPPLRLTVYDKDYVRRGVVPLVTEASCTIRRNAPGEASFTVDADHPRVADLTANGARVVVSYRAVDEYVPLFSGTVTDRTGNAPDGTTARTYTVSDDWDDIFNGVVAWPVPAAGIDSQGDESVFFTKTGAAETVLKEIVAPNVSRQGVPLTIPATTGAGSSVTVSCRFHSLAEKLFPTVDNAGVVAQVVQVGDERTLLCRAPDTLSRVITEGSGQIVDYDFQLIPPTATRVIVATGGSDSSTQRAFREYVSLTDGTVKLLSAVTGSDVTLEQEWGRSLCSFTEVSGDEGSLSDLMLQTAKETLDEGAPTASLAVTLQDTPQWRYGVSYQLGDRVRVQLQNAPEISDFVREVSFEWTASDGLVVSPVVGDWSDTSADAALVKAVTSMGRVLRDQIRIR